LPEYFACTVVRHPFASQMCSSHQCRIARIPKRCERGTESAWSLFEHFSVSWLSFLTFQVAQRKQGVSSHPFTNILVRKVLFTWSHWSAAPARRLWRGNSAWKTLSAS